MDQLESKVEAMGKQSTQSADAVPELAIADAVVESFLERASLQQNLLILGCVLSEGKQRHLDVPALCKSIEWNTPSAFRGFLGCMNALQLCVVTPKEKLGQTYTISSVHPKLKELGKDAFTNYVAIHFANDEDNREKWAEKLAALESLFA